jgi:uncharacterized membrane protein
MSAPRPPARTWAAGQRRVVQAVLYETIAVAVVAPVLTLVFAQPVASSMALTLLMSAIATVWNFVFNAVFEHWETRHPARGRPWQRRLAHGLGFELGLSVLLVPLMAYWMHISVWQALWADTGLMVFFLGYTVVFTWVFDRLFGLPASARLND